MALQLRLCVLAAIMVFCWVFGALFITTTPHITTLSTGATFGLVFSLLRSRGSRWLSFVPRYGSIRFSRLFHYHPGTSRNISPVDSTRGQLLHSTTISRPHLSRYGLPCSSYVLVRTHAIHDHTSYNGACSFLGLFLSHLAPQLPGRGRRHLFPQCLT